MPQAIIIAGPNGSGKSTAATELLPPGLPYINADLIAQDPSGRTDTPGDINAGRVLIARAQILEKLGEDFASKPPSGRGSSSSGFAIGGIMATLCTSCSCDWRRKTLPSPGFVPE